MRKWEKWGIIIEIDHMVRLYTQARSLRAAETSASQQGTPYRILTRSRHLFVSGITIQVTRVIFSCDFHLRLSLAISHRCLL